uniref:Brother of CDO-like n=2 Tax=Ciona intestinalis TaxID=7719 RepID=F6WM27_CIOIN
MLWVFVAVLLSGVAAIKNSSDVGRAGTEGSLNEGPQDFFETSSYVLLAPSPPIITSSSRTSEPTSYLLSWKPNQDEHFTSYKIRYIKDQHLKNTTLSKNDVSMLWYYISVSSNLTSRLLNNLEPSSLYQVEMVGITNNATSQLAVSSFRTGS